MLLSRIINNLTANAIRYTEHGGVLIGCRRRQGCWVIQVWDTGIGIAEEHCRIFLKSISRSAMQRGIVCRALGWAWR